MPEITIVHDAKRAETSRGRKAYTLTIDGQPSRYWCPTEAAAQRVARRLLLGRSGEAFGLHVVSTDTQRVGGATRGHDKPGRAKVVAMGEVTVEEVTLKSGRVKPREKMPGFGFELDGKEPAETFASEQAAKVGAACAAFLTRGKHLRFAEAEAAFRDKYGLSCKVQYVGPTAQVAAKDEQGNVYAVGIVAGEPIWFKLTVPAAPKE